MQNDSHHVQHPPRMSDVRPIVRQKAIFPPEPLQDPAMFVSTETSMIETVSHLPKQDVLGTDEWQVAGAPKTRILALRQETFFEVFKKRFRGIFQHVDPHSIPMPTRFASIAILVAFSVILLWFSVTKGWEMKERLINQGTSGYSDLASAAENLKGERYDGSLEHFTAAYKTFSQATEDFSSWKGALADVVGSIPGLSKIAAGKHLIEAGRHFAAAGIPLSRVASDISASKDAYTQGNQVSLLDFIDRINEPLKEAQSELKQAEDELADVKKEDIPESERGKFVAIQENLPIVISAFEAFSIYQPLFHELLGGNGPRQYLFLLQNNHEMRATGGFIGSYALLDMNAGFVRKFFVDGIFNPDGQLRENITPPKPIQKISAAWSLHDSNWFPDFPESAEKAMYFYEKTGGATTDGVITITPTVMQKLLTVTGPIDLPQYGLVVDADNFIPVIQEQVEVKYDKEENKPKKVLGDLFSAIVGKVFESRDKSDIARMAQALVDGLNEKHILIYLKHPEAQALVDKAGWSGRVLDTPKDYLSVIHSNINGYKTDGVISESIKHKSEIQPDGSIIDTVSITRTHNGGNTPYEWWNKVNADYLRVYVPEGSELLSAKGATWEFPEAPLDYKALGFKIDPQVAAEEQGMTVDEKSGTRISVDAGKTVFGAWVYVSPQESVTVEYRYKLPFRISMENVQAGDTDTYSVLYQKQSGSFGSALVSTIAFPDDIKPIWQTGTNLVPYGRTLRLEGMLKTDIFAGAVFSADR
jgi:hypothetical protein